MSDTSETANPSQGFKIHPPLLAGVLLVATLVLHLLIENGDTEAHEVIGLLLVAGGIGISFFAAALFQARSTTRNPYGEPSQFVVEWPFTFTRNPMYLGLTITLLGCALFFSSVIMVLAPIGFFLMLDRMVIANEEASMERMFGQEYVDYKARVRRWL